MARFAEGGRCRMLALVEHFGDRQDSGAPCGACDVCAPALSIKERRPSPDAEALAQREPRGAARGRKATRRGRAGRSSPRGRRGARARSGVELPSTGPSATLVAALRAWRLLESKRQRVPAFRVLTNRALVAIAEARPHDTASLQAVAGVGPKLLRVYGARIVQVCSGGS